MHTSAYYLLQNSNFLNCIRRFIRWNECSNLTKFVWALLYSTTILYDVHTLTYVTHGDVLAGLESGTHSVLHNFCSPPDRFFLLTRIGIKGLVM